MMHFNQSQSNSCNVLVGSDVLKRFFSCTDGLKDIFESASELSILDTKYLLCKHGAGKNASDFYRIKCIVIYT